MSGHALRSDRGEHGAGPDPGGADRRRRGADGSRGRKRAAVPDSHGRDRADRATDRPGHRPHPLRRPPRMKSPHRPPARRRAGATSAAPHLRRSRPNRLTAPRRRRARPAGGARSRRPADRRKACATCSPASPTGFHQQERAHRGRQRSTRTAISRRCGSTRASRAPRAKAVIARIKAADADGLELGDYKIPSLRGPARAGRARRSRAQAHADGSDLRAPPAGRPLPLFPRQQQQYRAAADAARDGGGADPDRRRQDAAQALDEFSPPHEPYQALEGARRAARQERQRPGDQIADGPLLKLIGKPRWKIARVPQLRERLGLDRRSRRPQIRRASSPRR